MTRAGSTRHGPADHDVLAAQLISLVADPPGGAQVSAAQTVTPLVLLMAGFTDASLACWQQAWRAVHRMLPPEEALAALHATLAVRDPAQPQPVDGAVTVPVLLHPSVLTETATSWLLALPWTHVAAGVVEAHLPEVTVAALGRAGAPTAAVPSAVTDAVLTVACELACELWAGAEDGDRHRRFAAALQDAQGLLALR